MSRINDIAAARKADEAIAAAWDLYWEAMLPVDRKRREVREAHKMVRYYSGRNTNSGQTIYYTGKIERLEAEITEIVAEATKLRDAAQALDAKLYKGWSRFFLVQHIHSSQYCSSFRPTTRVGWLPSVSGLTEVEAVQEYGQTLCTICFPSAPTELTTKAADPSVCKGSGKVVDRTLEHRTGFYSGNWGTCPDCGERVTIVGQSGIKLRKHKNPNF